MNGEYECIPTFYALSISDATTWFSASSMVLNLFISSARNCVYPRVNSSGWIIGGNENQYFLFGIQAIGIITYQSFVRSMCMGVILSGRRYHRGLPRNDDINISP